MTRELLPARRNGQRFDMTINHTDFSVNVGFYDDWRVGEVFLGMAKAAGTQADVYARDIAVLISIALQYGAPLGTLAEATTKTAEGAPEGLAGHVLQELLNFNLPEAKVTVISSRAIAPNPPPPPAEPGQVEPGFGMMPALTREQATLVGYTGDQCTHCNNFTMVRNGTCLNCKTCGTTTGCS